MDQTNSHKTATRIVSCSCIAAGVLTAFFAFAVLDQYEEELLVADMHIGMSFRWTLLSLPGIGAILGTVIGWIASYFIKRNLRA